MMTNLAGLTRRARAAALLAGAVLALSGCAGAGRRREPAKTRAPANVSQRAAPPLAKAVIRTAKAYLPEEDGGRAVPKDCSDFVVKVFEENGVKLPRTAVELSLKGTRVPSSRELRMGDLVFFSGSAANRIVGHVGIYVGNGIFIHLSRPEAGVTMESLYSDYYRRRYLTARRIVR